MQIIQQTTRNYGTNSYLLVDEDKKLCCWIDPGERLPKLEEYIEREGLTVAKILLTHGHGDHIGAAPFYKEKYGCPIGAPAAEKEVLENTSYNLTGMMACGPISLKCDEYYEDGDIVEPLGLKFLSTPGHTKGSGCYQYGDTLISGDLIFRGSVGRWDLPTGDYGVLMTSIDRILKPGTTYRILTGHGPETDAETERGSNPFSGYSN